MKSKGLISIIMNCHNGEAFLNEAIQSVLKQKYKKWEMIFWNNNSTDNSEKVFKSYRDKRLRYYFRKKKVSLYKSRNSAIKKAKGNNPAAVKFKLKFEIISGIIGPRILVINEITKKIIIISIMI